MGINSLFLEGRLARDPERKEVSGDTVVVEIVVACDNGRSGTSGDASSEGSSESAKKADFIPVTVFGKQAEAVLAHKNKGDQVIVEGYLKHETWQTEGQPRSKIAVRARRVQFGASKRQPAEASSS